MIMIWRNLKICLRAILLFLENNSNEKITTDRVISSLKTVSPTNIEKKSSKSLSIKMNGIGLHYWSFSLHKPWFICFHDFFLQILCLSQIKKTTVVVGICLCTDIKKDEMLPSYLEKKYTLVKSSLLIF